MSKKHKIDVIQGNSACIEGALLAGCSFFACYPITPSNEIAEEASEKFPLQGGNFIQMEDEIGAILTLVGASWGGKKALTATSGPGLCLMQEAIGWAALSETPLVIINVQRGGPASGQSTSPSQGDVFAMRYGSNGDYPIIVLAPSTAQDCLELTVEAFNYAEKYRTPVILASDEIVAHTREKVIIPDAGEVRVLNRKKPNPEMPKDEYLPFKPDSDDVPPMPNFFEGYKLPILSQVHGYDGYRAAAGDEAAEMLHRLHNKIEGHVDDIAIIVEDQLDDAEIAFLSYGSVARAAKTAIDLLRKKGIRVGNIHIKTLWPFPEARIRQYSKRFKTIMVPEMNVGKMVKEVRLAAEHECDVISLPKIGGVCHTPFELVEAVAEVMKNA